MGRIKKKRRIHLPPKVNYFASGSQRSGADINLGLDEFEAIKLLDFENMNQEKVAVCMNVSRPTLTRIYEKARQKIAAALVEGRNIKIGGGDFYYAENWYACQKCDITYNVYDEKENCPMCNSNEQVSRLAETL
ncbi:MAG: DUF134 domain-containing protein [Bacteroidales bacterium]